MNTFELTARTAFFPYWVVYVLIFCVCILAVLKYQREVAYSHIGEALLKAPSSIPFTKQEAGIFGWINWGFLLNYFIASALACYMTFVYYGITHYELVVIPTLIYFIQLFSFQLIGWVSGESKKIKELVMLLNVIYHAIGIIFVPLLFVWMLNPKWSIQLMYSILIVFICLQIFRIVKSISLASRYNIWWYYIILYLCGLEIWPMIIVYAFSSPYFIG